MMETKKQHLKRLKKEIKELEKRCDKEYDAYMHTRILISKLQEEIELLEDNTR